MLCSFCALWENQGWLQEGTEGEDWFSWRCGEWRPTICQQRWSKCRMKDTNSRGEVLHWTNLIIANMELKFLHSLQWRAILMKCLMVFILFRVLGSFKISVATQKVSWFITSSNCFRLPLPTEESSLNKSSTYLKHVTEGFKTGLKGRILSSQQMVCQKTVTVTNIQSLKYGYPLVICFNHLSGTFWVHNSINFNKISTPMAESLRPRESFHHVSRRMASWQPPLH